MISFQINDKVYATNNDLSGFFSRREHEGAYQQQRGNLDIGFANEREFQKFCRAWDTEQTAHDNYDPISKCADVTSSGRFVWRHDRDN